MTAVPPNGIGAAPIKVGFVGLSASGGWGALALAPSLLQPSLQDKYVLTAISTTSAASSAVSAAKYSEQLGRPIKPFYGDTKQIASDPDVDFVVVSVKAPCHRDAVLPVIEAGKPFFLEWPVGKNLEEAREMRDAAKRKGVRGLIGLQGRQSLVGKKVKELIDSGKIGKVFSVTVNTLVPRELFAWGPLTKETNSYILDKTNGVTIIRTGIGHFLDSFVHILGEFSSVSAFGVTHYPTSAIVNDAGEPTGKTLPTTVPDHISITGTLKSGALVTIVIRSGLPSTQGRRQLLWEIDGDEGSIKLESDKLFGSYISGADPDLYVNGEKVEVEGHFENVVGFLTKAWEEFTKGDQGFYTTVDDAVKRHELLAAIEKSLDEGGKQVSIQA